MICTDDKLYTREALRHTRALRKCLIDIHVVVKSRMNDLFGINICLPGPLTRRLQNARIFYTGILTISTEDRLLYTTRNKLKRTNRKRGTIFFSKLGT